MKILISGDTYYPQVNGCSYFTQRLAEYLKMHGHDVLVIAPSEKFAYTDTIVHTVRVFGVRSYPVFFYPGFRFCFLPFKNKHIEKAIDDFKPDVIHIQAHFAVNRAVLGFAKAKKIPVVGTNHFMPENLVHYLPLPQSILNMIIVYGWKDFAKVYRKLDNITTPTKTAADLIAPHFDRTITPISCGIDMTVFKPSNNGQYLKERYNIGSSPVLLYVGRLDKEKNLDLVITAAATAMQKTTFQLVIAGSGAEKNNLMALSKKLGIEKNVIFTGFVPNEDLPNLYCLADCFINAGTAELQSIVTMEAMASGLPVLAVNAVALPELVHNRENGFLFTPGDTKELGEMMVTIFSDANLRKNMSTKSLEFIANHSIIISIKRFEEIYKNAIALHTH